MSGIVGYAGASWTFLVVFAICSGFHLVLGIWRRRWYMVWFVVGGILELSAYVGDHTGKGPQTVQAIIGPIFLAASVYISFDKLIKVLNAQHLFRMNMNLMTALFIVGDIVSFGMQVAGVVLMMILDNKAAGQALTIIGFVIQLASFSTFVWLVYYFQKVLADSSTVFTSCRYHWKKYFKVLFAAAALFLIRNIFRVIEYAMGYSGFLFDHTIFANIFDSSTMSLLMILLIIYHPSFFMPKKDKETEENKELVGSDRNAL